MSPGNFLQRQLSPPGQDLGSEIQVNILDWMIGPHCTNKTPLLCIQQHGKSHKASWPFDLFSGRSSVLQVPRFNLDIDSDRCYGLRMIPSAHGRRTGRLVVKRRGFGILRRCWPDLRSKYWYITDGNFHMSEPWNTPKDYLLQGEGAPQSMENLQSGRPPVLFGMGLTRGLTARGDNSHMSWLYIYR